MQICPACAQENPDGFRLCGMCGASLTAAAPAAREERKVVTVLFTDLVGFTSRAEKLDPEDVRATLSPYYSRLRTEIERHGGSVEKFIGDAVMAVFGAPAAHEDDPERAVRAAIAIHESVGEDLQIRTAVNTGEALVALGAQPSEGEGMVSGDVVNTAARLQSAAPVNGILVGEATYRATRHTIDYREAAPVEAKGKSDPIPVWEVVGARARFGLDVEQRLRAPLIGRVRERTFLGEALARCRAESATQLVTLVGVPGIGKSRLVTELFQIVEDDPELIFWRQGRSLPYGEGLSYWALGEIVKAQAGILESDAVEEVEAKVAATVESLIADPAERGWVEQHVRTLAGLASTAEQSSDRRIEAFAAWRRLLEALAEHGPLVLIFEDLHWADDGLLDFVDSLAEWVADVPMLVIGTARPELLDRRPGWGGGKRNAFTLSVGALSADETALLLASLLDQTLLPAEVQAAVLRRAEGNPLYAEEYVRMLQDRGFLVRSPSGWQLTHTDELPLPETVQGMIAARLDALAPAEKELIQDAAVIGKVFWPAALQALAPGQDSSGSALHALERKEFVRRDRRSAVAGETQYAFLHALVRDVAYGQIPRATRVDKHRLAAEWIAALAPDRSEDRAEMLAHHYREALRLAKAAGLDTESLRAPAQAALAEASARAVSLNAWQAAEELALAAVELTELGDPQRPHLLLRAARANTFGATPTREFATAAAEGFLEQSDIAHAAETEALLSWICWWLADRDGSVAHADRAVQLAQGQPTTQGSTRAYAQKARVLSLAGREAEAVDLGRRALAMAEEIEDPQTASHALNTIGMSRIYLGEPEGLDDLKRSLELAEEAAATDEIGKALNNLSNMCWALGRLDEATEYRLACRELALRTGDAAGLVWGSYEEILDFDVRGDLNEAFKAAQHCLEVHGHKLSEGVARGIIARVAAIRGDLAEALEQSELALVCARAVADPQQLGPVLAIRAFALHVAGRDAQAQAAIDEILSDPTMVGYMHWVSDLVVVLAERGRGAEIAAALVPKHGGNPWQEAARAVGANEFAQAADRYGAMGARYFEAWATLFAAERGERVDLVPARAYFEQIGAASNLRRCETVLPASA
jgi:class 3 adenylate cyclase/tetratricopeptide (TPR) repeat protein